MPQEESKEILVECMVKAFIKVIEKTTEREVHDFDRDTLTEEVHRCLEDFVNIKIIQAKAEVSKPVNGITGELKIWKPDNTLTTLSLSEEDMWALKAAVSTTEKQAVNEPGFANGNGKAALINLAAKLKTAYEADAQMGCTNKSCGCKK